jgi:hypothetical protein
MNDWLTQANMRIWLMLGVICIAGAIGGTINALLTEQGFVKPFKQRNGDVKIYRPGFLGNILTGSIAAGISWGLYGPFASFVILGLTTSSEPPVFTSGLTLSSLVGAVLVGAGGARWLTNEADKNLLRTAASRAASAKASTVAAEQLALASPAEALEIANELEQVSDSK